MACHECKKDLEKIRTLSKRPFLGLDFSISSFVAILIFIVAIFGLIAIMPFAAVPFLLIGVILWAFNSEIEKFILMRGTKNCSCRNPKNSVNNQQASDKTKPSILTLDKIRSYSCICGLTINLDNQRRGYGMYECSLCGLRHIEELTTTVNECMNFRVDNVVTISKPDRIEISEPIIQCQICGEALNDKKHLVYCQSCRTPHHEDCWEYNGECSIYACRSKVATPS